MHLLSDTSPRHRINQPKINIDHSFVSIAAPLSLKCNSFYSSAYMHTVLDNFRVTKDVTLAAGKGVVHAGERVADSTVQAGKLVASASVNAMQDTMDKTTLLIGNLVLSTIWNCYALL